MIQVLQRLRHRAARFVPADPMTVAPQSGMLSLSFDDFPESAWTEAGPILAAHGVKATYYVAGGLCGGRNLDLPQFEVEHLQALVEAGHEVGCHTFEHVSVLGLDAATLNASLDRNARWVAERLDGYAMTTFAFPFGDWSVGAKRLVAKRFDCGRGVRDGVNRGRADRAGLSAIGLESRRLPGYDLEALVAETAARKGWLIAYGHDVSDQPTPYGCRPDDLDRFVRLAREAGLEIAPVGQALGAVGPYQSTPLIPAKAGTQA
jgi:peptidoglycan/xylan/chitin deacetylase (PgdA/CDA1 family)